MKRVLLVGILAMLFIAACGNNAAPAAAPAVPAGDAAPSADGTIPADGASPADSGAGSMGATLANFFAKGLGVECTFETPEGGRETLQFLGKKAHVTTTGPDASELYVTEKGVFVKSDQQGCDWIVMPTDTSSLPEMEEDWSLSDMERAYDVLYKNVHCVKKSLSAADFTPSGKVCSMEELMQQMG